MEPLHMVSMALDFLGVAVSLIILTCIAVKQEAKTNLDRRFMLFIACNALTQLSCALSWYFDRHTGSHSRVLNQVTTFLFYAMGYVVVFSFIYYLIGYLNQRTRVSGAWLRAAAGICIFSCAACVLSLFNGMYYAINADNIYTRGEFYPVSQIFLYLGLLLIGVIIFFHRKSFTVKETLFIISYLAFPVILNIPHIMSFGLGLVCTSSTLSMVAVYAGVQSEQANLLAQQKIELAQHEELKERAYTDALTGILNRWQFMNLAAKELERAMRSEADSYLVLFDIDYFKEVNDTYGHLAGDEVLKSVTKRVVKAIRPYDLFGRYGGEEFILFVSDISEQDILKHTERIRMAICETPIELDNDDLSIAVTASFGVASVKMSNSMDEIISRADEALYKAKDGGRNLVVMSECAKQLKITDIIM